MNLSEDKAAVRLVARAIANVIADGVIRDDPKLRTLDGLGQAMARTSIAEGMVGSLAREAIAAIEAVEALLAEPEAAA